jgi:uncharacterized protein involved in exopolysaccharide biosynthesis
VNIDQILKQLREERDRLTRAIDALEGGATSSHARGPRAAAKKKSSGGGITAAGRKRLSELMKKRWAERRKASKK